MAGIRHPHAGSGRARPLTHLVDQMLDQLGTKCSRRTILVNSLSPYSKCCPETMSRPADLHNPESALFNDLADLRTSLDVAARVARANLLFLLVVGVFTGILVANTNDEVLLKSDTIELPLMEAGVPVSLFYAVTPVLYLILYFNLFLRLSRLALIAKFLHEKICRLPEQEQQYQAALIFPFDFLQLILTTRAALLSSLISFIVVAITVYVLPLLLLLWMQLRFLSYQDDSITLIHQIVLTLQGAFTVAFVIAITHTLRKKDTDRWWSIRQSIHGSTPVLVTIVAFFLSSVFVWFVAVVPGSALDRRVAWEAASAAVFDDWWLKDDPREEYRKKPKYFRRYLYLAGKNIFAEKRSYATSNNYASNGGAETLASSETQTLDLSSRTFRYASFQSTHLSHINFSSSDLYRSIFAGSSMYNVSFRNAGLELTDFRDVKLEMGNLYRADLDGADLRFARFNGVNVLGVKLNGSNLEQASLKDVRQDTEGSSAWWPVELNWASLSGATLTGVDFARAELNGAYLGSTEFDGKYLTGTVLTGVILSHSKLNAASFERATLKGVDMRGAELAGSDLSGVKMLFTYIGDAKVELNSGTPKKKTIEKDICDGYELRGRQMWMGSEQSGQCWKLDAIQRLNADKDIVPKHLSSGSECVWRDQNSPFAVWPNADISCEGSFIDFVCRQDERAILDMLYEMHHYPLTIDRANNAFALLKTETEGCVSKAQVAKRSLCTALQRWANPHGQYIEYPEGSREEWSRVRERCVY